MMLIGLESNLNISDCHLFVKILSVLSYRDEKGSQNFFLRVEKELKHLSDMFSSDALYTELGVCLW